MAETKNAKATLKKKINGTVYNLNIKTTADAISYEDGSIKTALDNIIANQDTAKEKNPLIEIISEDDLKSLSTDNIGELKVLRKQGEDDKLLAIIPSVESESKIAALLISTTKFTLPTSEEKVVEPSAPENNTEDTTVDKKRD